MGPDVPVMARTLSREVLDTIEGSGLVYIYIYILRALCRLSISVSTDLYIYIYVYRIPIYEHI